VFPILANIPIQEIRNEFLSKYKVQLYIQRDDLIHSEVSGNKWRKLKYNVNEYFFKGCQSILTFGGAYSNHIVATAAAGKLLGIQTHGIIRGEEVMNPTLENAEKDGMTLHFISREEYKKKHESKLVINVLESLKKPYVIPEGGANILGMKGCGEIVQESHFDVVTCACGTGSTFSGIVSSLNKNQYAIGFPVLKGGGFLEKDIIKNLQLLESENQNWKLETDFHFGGYAKYRPDLIEFIRAFWENNSIKLDPVYTGKAMYGLHSIIESGQLMGKKILFIHTGGLQGIQGFEDRYQLRIFQN
tara:strand:+ start:103 stop:1008 length:906 start_codon:yes stop_codon:yes gene_type:complete